MIYRALVVIGVFLGLFSKSFAETPIIIDGSKDEYSIPAKQLDILIDTAGVFSLEDVLLGNQKNKFIPNPVPFPHIEEFKYTYWVKFTIIPNLSHGARNKSWVLEELDPHFKSIDFYLVDDSGNIIATKTGISLPFQQREYQHKNFVFDVPLNGKKYFTFYVRFQSNDYNVFLFKLRTTNFFTKYALNEYYILGLYYGILFIMALYNLLLFITVREKVYFYYVLYVISCAFISFSEDGLGFQYIWPNTAWINPYIKMYSPLAFLIFFTIYAKSFLEIPTRMPKVSRFLNLVILLFSLYYFLNLDFINFYWKIPVYAVPYFLIFVISIKSFYDGFRPARFFIFGYSIILSSIIILILRFNEIIGWDNLLTIYSFNIGIVFEILVLTIALGDKIKIIKKEKELAQQLIIEQLQENDKLKEKVNRELEELVKERTKEINLQKEVIAEQNDELKFANERLEEQANEILRMNALLSEENKTLHIEKEVLNKDKDQLIEKQNELETNVNELKKARILLKDVDFAEFSNIYPDKESCISHLIEIKWGDGFKCIRCKNEKYFDGHEPHSRRCTKCGYDESVTAFTIFHRLRFPLNKAFYMLFLIYSNNGKITTLELSSMLSLRQSTCWSFRKKVLDRLENNKKANTQDHEGWIWLIKTD